MNINAEINQLENKIKKLAGGADPVEIIDLVNELMELQHVKANELFEELHEQINNLPIKDEVEPEPEPEKGKNNRVGVRR